MYKQMSLKYKNKNLPCVNSNLGGGQLKKNDFQIMLILQSSVNFKEKTSCKTNKKALSWEIKNLLWRRVLLVCWDIEWQG